MTRWHQDSCQSPDVVVNSSNNPTCRACGNSCPSIVELLMGQPDAQHGLKLPSDEPRGEMGLWWPKGVPYVNTRALMLGPEEEIQASRAARIPPSSFTPSESANFHIYGNTLRHDEFRLVCLTAVPRKNYPIHLSLETYTYNNRPEYETVSYMCKKDSAVNS